VKWPQSRLEKLFLATLHTASKHVFSQPAWQRLAQWSCPDRESALIEEVYRRKGKYIKVE
jgi:hypothetical protein